MSAPRFRFRNRGQHGLREEGRVRYVVDLWAADGTAKMIGYVHGFPGSWRREHPRGAPSFATRYLAALDLLEWVSKT